MLMAEVELLEDEEAAESEELDLIGLFVGEPPPPKRASGWSWNEAR